MTYGSAVGFEKLTVSNSVKQFTSAQYEKGNNLPDATVAFLTIEGTAGTHDVRYTFDGTTPVAATTGHLLQAGQSITILGPTNIRKFKMIRDQASDVTAHVTFFL